MSLCWSHSQTPRLGMSIVMRVGLLVLYASQSPHVVKFQYDDIVVR